MTLARPYFPPVPAADFPPHLHLYFMTVGAVIPGFCEELFFRGMLFRIGANTPGWLLVLLSAAGFALWHLNTPLYLVHTFVLGVMFGVLVLMTKRVAPAAIAHTVANAAFGALLLTGVISASG
jgi:membrane protease YdiL (CAAX protease family)